MSAQGWYGPPNSRRWHWITPDARSLCGKWFILAWDSSLIDKAFGPAEGDCATCKRKLDAYLSAHLPNEKGTK